MLKWIQQKNDVLWKVRETFLHNNFWQCVPVAFSMKSRKRQRYEIFKHCHMLAEPLFRMTNIYLNLWKSDICDIYYFDRSISLRYTWLLKGKQTKYSNWYFVCKDVWNAINIYICSTVQQWVVRMRYAAVYRFHIQIMFFEVKRNCNGKYLVYQCTLIFTSTFYLDINGRSW